MGEIDQSVWAWEDSDQLLNKINSIAEKNWKSFGIQNRMTRVITKIGDMFSVVIDDHTKKYFQYVANDLTQLNSDVIRAFKKSYPLSEKAVLPAIVKGEVEFYAHCVTKWGVKMNFWEKVGNCNDVGTVDVYFRGTNDYGHKVGEEPVKVSHNWYVWKINDDKFTSVGKLEGKYQKSEIGLVINPESIIYRMRTGEYDFKAYPSY